MYSFADSPAKKLVGMATEIWSFASLISALITFNNDCVAPLRAQFVTNTTRAYALGLKDGTVTDGPGSIAFIVAGCVCLFRFLLHLLTPLPKRAKGFCAPTLKMCRCDGCMVLYTDEGAAAAAGSAADGEAQIFVATSNGGVVGNENAAADFEMATIER